MSRRRSISLSQRHAQAVGEGMVSEFRAVFKASSSFMRSGSSNSVATVVVERMAETAASAIVVEQIAGTVGGDRSFT